MTTARCTDCREMMDPPIDDGSPYEGLFACYGCELYHDGTHWVLFSKADALVDTNVNDPTFKVKVHMGILHVSS